jgi:hypothetical protein
MKFASHHRENTWSEGFVGAYTAQSVAVKIVDYSDSEVVAQVADCDGVRLPPSHNVGEAKLKIARIGSLADLAGDIGRTPESIRR